VSGDPLTDASVKNAIKARVLARAREIDAILVTELSRWGRSTQDLVQTLDDLHSWQVSVHRAELRPQHLKR
jgi:DNA invertase Pin-like site-specific DNA recombinase